MPVYLLEGERKRPLAQFFFFSLSLSSTPKTAILFLSYRGINVIAPFPNSSHGLCHGSGEAQGGVARHRKQDERVLSGAFYSLGGAFPTRLTRHPHNRCAGRTHEERAATVGTLGSAAAQPEVAPNERSSSR